MSIDHPAEFIDNISLKVDHVHLKVTNLEESLDFYQSILGYAALRDSSSGKIAHLGPQKSIDESPSTIMVLEQIDTDQRSYKLEMKKREAGLYHFAILLPERKYLASFLRHIRNNLDPQFYDGMADHAVSESIYLHDPDHNGIEVYRDRKPSEWKWLGENKVYMVTEPLDVNDLLSQKNQEIWYGFPSRTVIGHVHLHVSNITKAKAFYHKSLGLHHTATYPGAYFFAADGYHHHVATNTWLGTNILNNSADDPTRPGLDHFALSMIGEQGDLKKLKDHLSINGITIHENSGRSNEQNKSSFYIYDSDGIKIQFLMSI